MAQDEAKMAQDGAEMGQDGASWRQIGASWRQIGASWRKIGTSWRQIGASWRKKSARPSDGPPARRPSARPKTKAEQEKSIYSNSRSTAPAASYQIIDYRLSLYDNILYYILNIE